MVKISVDVEEFARIALPTLRSPGLLLVSACEKDRLNVMTIGWGLIGTLWGLPTFVAFVRPSRYTHQILEQAKDFTVNLPSRGMEEAVSTCGTLSGRKLDKFRETGLKPAPSRKVISPIIEQCIAHLECSIIYRTSIDEQRVPASIKSFAYPRGDYHDMYFGEILEAYADEDYEAKLP